MYIPKNRIKTNLYTSGREYTIKSTGEDYAGFYHSLYDGTLYTGKTPNDPPIQELIKDDRSSQSDTTALNSDLPFQSYVDVYDGIVYDGQIQDAEGVDRYHVIRREGYDKFQYLPFQHYPKPTEEDYKLGSFTRYFCVKYNEDIFKELSKESYESLLNQEEESSWQLYFPFQIQWTLVGEREVVATTNSNIIKIQERAMKRKGLDIFLKRNYLKFYK